jgi:hypothetical protein
MVGLEPADAPADRFGVRGRTELPQYIDNEPSAVTIAGCVFEVVRAVTTLKTTERGQAPTAVRTLLG